jgi:hypothetical protein
MDYYDSIPEAIPEALDLDSLGTPSGIPADRYGNIIIPELVGRTPTYNESALIAGNPIAMASSNVDEMWWRWGHEDTYDPRLFVRFLDGALYSYNGPDASLTLAGEFLETMSPGRFVWNVLRILWPVPDSRGTGPGTYTLLIAGSGQQRGPNVVRQVSDAEHRRSQARDRKRKR